MKNKTYYIRKGIEEEARLEKTLEFLARKKESDEKDYQNCGFCLDVYERYLNNEVVR